MTTTTTGTPLSCPPSAVRDMILTWTDSAGEFLVFPGDLIVHAGRWKILASAERGTLPNGAAVVHVDVEGNWLPCCFPADSLVAVCRYDTGEGA
jgi:hypothetical protein